MTVILFAPYELQSAVDERRRNRRDAIGCALALIGGAILLHGLRAGLRMPRREC